MLDGSIESEIEISPRGNLDLLHALDQDPSPQGVPFDNGRGGLAPEVILIAKLQPLQPLGISADKAEHLTGELALGIIPLRILVHADALNVEGFDPLCFLGCDLPLDPDKGLLCLQPLLQLPRFERQDPRQTAGESGRLFEPARPDINRLGLHAQSQRLSRPVKNRASFGLDNPFLEMLPLAQPSEAFSL